MAEREAPRLSRGWRRRREAAVERRVLCEPGQGPPHLEFEPDPSGRVGGGGREGERVGKGEQLSKSLKGPKALGAPVCWVRNTRHGLRSVSDNAVARTEPGQR